MQNLSQPFPKPAHTSDDKETGRKPSIKRQTTGYRKELFAGLLLWWGTVDFPPWLGAVDFPPWPEVDGCPPWFGVDPCLLPPGLGWVLSCCFPEAPIAGVLVWAGLGGRGQPLGWASGVLGIGCLWRWETR